MKKKNTNLKDTLTGIGLVLGATIVAGATMICDAAAEYSTTTTTTAYNNDRAIEMPSLDSPKIFLEVLDLKRKSDAIYHNTGYRMSGYVNMDGSAKIRENTYGGCITYNYKRFLQYYLQDRIVQFFSS